jgi:hypothetical protein
VFELHPFVREKPVFKVNRGFSNQLVAEEVVVIPDFDFQLGGTGESGFQLEAFEEPAVLPVLLEYLGVAAGLLPELDEDIWVAEGISVALRQSKGVEDIDSNHTLGLQ